MGVTDSGKDKGFDPLLLHINKNGLQCRRISSLEELAIQYSVHTANTTKFVCPKCGKASTIEHHGGRWCSNCSAGEGFAVKSFGKAMGDTDSG